VFPGATTFALLANPANPVAAMLLVNSQNAINVALYEKLSFDLVRDIAPVGRVESRPGLAGPVISAPHTVG
jgi:hypothetical protein